MSCAGDTEMRTDAVTRQLSDETAVTRVRELLCVLKILPICSRDCMQTMQDIHILQ